MWKSKYRPREYNEANIMLLGDITYENEWVGTFDRHLSGIVNPDTIIYGACRKMLADGDSSFSVYSLYNGHIEKIGSVRKSQLTSPAR